MSADDSRAALASRRFYREALSEAERAGMSLALEVEGVDEEIALLRLLLRNALEQHRDDLPLLFRGIELLTRAVSARYRLDRRSRRDLGASLREALSELLPGWTGATAADTPEEEAWENKPGPAA